LRNRDKGEVAMTYEQPALPDVPGLEELFIAGKWRTPNSAATVPVICPANEAVVAHVALPGIADADAAVAAARTAFDSGPWPKMSVAERVAYCSRLADALEARMHRMNIAWMLEAGAPLAHSEMINTAAGRMIWRNALEIAPTLKFEERRTGRSGDVIVLHEPIGTVLAILTYNGPVVLMGMKVIPALLAGCPVIIKPAPESPLTSRIIAEAIESVGFPPGVISVLAAGSDVTQHLVGHAGIDMIALTGGTAIAVDVVRRSAARLARTALELGGKSPAIIADDIALDKVLATLVDGATGFLGQVCVSLSRILVSEKRYEEVVEAMAAAYKRIKVGLPWDPSSNRGPLAVERARARSEKAVAGAIAAGAKVVAGGRRPPHLTRGWYYEPTLLRDVHNDMEVAQEEVFGPVTAVIRYRDIDDAVRLANDSKYGLAASVYCADDALALAIARRLRSGGVALNLAGISLTEPFGGVKQSGWGRECGSEGIFEFTDVKQVLLSGSYTSA
jgi:acyl-CoA reductase-like NAD-dependent aldehyde dehydrogenase